MNPQDVFYVGKYVQILHSSKNKSKIYQKLTKPIDWMGRIQTAYLLCTRITLETTALRVMCKMTSGWRSSRPGLAAGRPAKISITRHLRVFL